MLRAENQGLLLSLKARHEVFSWLGDQISSAFATSLADVAAYVPPFESAYHENPKMMFLDWLEV